jgi:predicted DNA-binding protein with PD1-like motif
MQAMQIHNGFFLVFERGEELMPTLIRFCEENDVHWGQFQAIGAVEDVEIGYYDLASREYIFRAEAGPFEVASMDGNISEMESEEPVVHVHAVLARCDDSLECIGGHLRRARVALTLELCLWQVTQPLIRSRDEETGLNLINFAV